jgi:hypothetical protein
MRMTLEPERIPLDCLKSALQTGGNITFSSLVFQTNQTISSNGTIAASQSNIGGQIESVGANTGSTYSDTTPTRITARAMPTTATVFDYYIANGTAISWAALPKSGTTGILEKIVLSPGYNPYGATNPKGIYVINCGGAPILIKNVRIVGTLVLLNAGASSLMNNSVNWEPAVANLPALMVQGSIALTYNMATLGESAGVNFNPPGAPYLGVADTDTGDTYPSRINGLVYISGNMTSTNHPYIDGGLIVNGTLNSDTDLEVMYRSTYFDDPPPGFTAPSKMKLSPATWRQVVE